MYINIDKIEYRLLPLTAVPDFFITKTEIDSMPAADVQEVRHGKWIKDEFGDIICSECKQYPIENEDGYPIQELKDYTPLFCPNCGAKMED